jgi:fructose-1,6-bisphosphatase/inositol monophosphatase family enzyme
VTVTIDPAKVSSIIREAALAEILPRFGQLASDQIREKKPGQLVTDADVEAERLLTRRLTELLPGSAVVGEESVESDPGLLGALDRPGLVWIIDPVDGTANFAKGNPRFAVIVALVEDGVTTHGWIHDPVPDRTIVARLGEGAWEGATRLSVLPEAAMEQMSASIKRSAQLASRFASVGRKGSAAHDYVDLVTSRLHVAHFTQLMPWDHAAGVLIHAEAGGYGRLMTGQPYGPAGREGQLLLAPTEGVWRSTKAVLDQKG